MSKNKILGFDEDILITQGLSYERNIGKTILNISFNTKLNNNQIEIIRMLIEDNLGVQINEINDNEVE